MDYETIICKLCKEDKMDNLQFNNQNQNTNAVKLDKDKLIKYGVIAACAVVVLIIVIALFNAIFGSSYKTPIKKTIQLINKKSEASLDYRKYSALDTQYEFAVMYYEAMDEDDDAYEDYIEALEDEFGDNYKIKYKITDADKLSSKKLEDLEEEIADSYEEEADDADETLELYEELWDEEDISSKNQKKLTKAFEKYIKECEKVKVTAAYKVDLECTIKGSEGDEDFEIEDLIIAKVNGEWIFTNSAINPYTIVKKSITD